MMTRVCGNAYAETSMHKCIWRTITRMEKVAFGEMPRNAGLYRERERECSEKKEAP